MNGHSNSGAPAGQPGGPRTVERRADILRAAREVIRERGFHATRLVDIGERVGLTAPAVTYYFPSKAELLVEALGSAEQERFYAEVEPAIARLPGGPDRLRVALAAGLNATDWLLWLELCAVAMRDAAAKAGLERVDRRWHAMLAGILRDGERRGDWTLGATPETLALRLATLVDGLSIQLLLFDLPLDAVREACARWVDCELGITITAADLRASWPPRE